MLDEENCILPLLKGDKFVSLYTPSFLWKKKLIVPIYEFVFLKAKDQRASWIDVDDVSFIVIFHGDEHYWLGIVVPILNENFIS